MLGTTWSYKSTFVTVVLQNLNIDHVFPMKLCFLNGTYAASINYTSYYEDLVHKKECKMFC